MLRHKNIDRICAAALAVTLLLFGRLYRKVIRELPDGAPVR